MGNVDSFLESILCTRVNVKAFYHSNREMEES